MPVDARLLELLRCPACEERPEVREEGEELVCVECGRRYPVEGGIPRMIVEGPAAEDAAGALSRP